MGEYEYNFKVDSIKPYIKYCEENNYKGKVIKQKRIVYENVDNNKIVARITTNTEDDKRETILDFKNVKENNELLKVSNESLPIIVDKSNKKQIESMLETINFKEVSSLYRTRYVYTKDDVTFEIDDYVAPKMKVVAIEGIKEKVDMIFAEMENIKNGKN